jgi:integrase/recombinase XerD
MKVNRNGKARVLTPDELEQVFFELDHPYTLAAQICYYAAARVGEVMSLQVEDISDDYITFRKANTKKKRTRRAAIPRLLRQALDAADLPDRGYLFPSASKSGHLTPRSLEYKLKTVCELLDLPGVSTHSFRRSMATRLHKEGFPMRAIAGVTGHQSLSALAEYLDISTEEAQQMYLDFLNTTPL